MNVSCEPMEPECVLQLGVTPLQSDLVGLFFLHPQHHLGSAVEVDVVTLRNN
jgi:hypothetical protein